MSHHKTALLIDLSGTLHIEDSVTPDAVESLRLLYSQPDRFRLKFVTNTTKSTSYLHSRLLRCGFDFVKPTDIFSSLSAAKKLIDEHKLRPLFFLEPEAMEDFEQVDVSHPNSVVIGLAPNLFNFQSLNEAFKLLIHNETSQLIAIHKGRYYKRQDGLALGPGPFVECLEFASGKRAVVVGKPEIEFFRQALDSMREAEEENFSIKDAIMIGDDVRDDVMGAIEFGMKGVLVRTGKYRAGDELRIPEEKRNCVENFAEAVELILNGHKFL